MRNFVSALVLGLVVGIAAPLVSFANENACEDPRLAGPFIDAVEIGISEAPVYLEEEDLPPCRVGQTETGVASYYARSLHGNLTANGERYDHNALTAAHRTLRFGTVVEVTDSRGRKTTVRINDRGPYARNRIIDLSGAASKQMSMGQSGTSRVTVTVIACP